MATDATGSNKASCEDLVKKKKNKKNFVQDGE
jgi:hypothetical protein